MKKYTSPFLIFCLVILLLPASAQTTFRFSYDVGAFDIAGGMVENPAGEFVIAGLNNSFGPYYGNAVKIDNSGNVVWAKSYTGGFATNFSDIKNVSPANGGGYIITGSSTSGGGGALLVRIDNSGALLWAKRYQLPDKPSANASNEYGNAVIETSDGGFLVGGGVDYFWDGVSPTTTDTSSAMGFKVDASGNLLWSKVWTITTTNPDEHYINDVAEVSDGYFFVGQSSEGSGTLSSNGDYPSNSLVIKTTTAGALTYIRRWGAGNTTSQSINSALKLANGNVLLGGIDDVNAFLVTMTGPGASPATTGLNRRINGAAFPPRTLIIQDIMENADGNYSVIGMQIEPLTLAFYTAIYKMNSTTGALIFGRGYTPIGLSSILPEGGLAADQGYYVGMTDQQAGGFNYNVIRTDATGQLGAAAGCGSTSLNPGTAAYSVTFTTPTSSNFNLATASTFTPTVSNMTPTVTQHCLNTACVPPAAATTVTATPSPICAGQSSSITASGPASGVTYNVYTASTGGTLLGSTPLTVTPGSTTTYYVETSLNSNPTCVSTTRPSVTVTITPAVTPTTGFSYTTPVCANGTNPTPIPVGGFTAGGTYSSTGGLSINASTGVINLALSTPGTYTVTYNVAATGCNPAGSSTATITINPVTTPVTGFSYTTPVCANGINPTPIPVGGFTSGGTYSSTAGLTINASTGVIDLSTSTPGTYTVTYAVGATACGPAGSSTGSITITPNTTPGTSFSYITPVCASGTNPTVITGGGFTSGGTYSSTAGLTINATNGTIDLATSTPGTYTVTYSIAAAGCQLAGTGTASITINPTTTPVTVFSYASPVCANGTNPTVIPGGGFTTGGTYSSTAGLTIDASTGTIDLTTSTPGTYVITYNVPATGCAIAGSGNTNITINPSTSPVTSFSYTTPVCANGTNPTVIPGGGFTGGGIYSSTAGLTIDGTTGTIDLATSTPGTYTVTYSVATAGCMLAGSGTASITINPITTPVTGFSYTTPVCANGTNPVPVPVGGFTTGGTYSSTAGLTIDGTTGTVDLTTSTPGTYTITYDVPATGCAIAGNSTTSLTIDPTTTPITGFAYTTPVCANGINPVPIPAGGFTSGGTYSSTAGLTIDATTGVIDLSTTTPGTYTVTYSTAAAGCMLAGTGTASITINPITTPVTGFSYSTPVCVNGTNPIPTPVGGFTTGGVYSSTAGLTINATTGVVDLSTSTAGTYTVTYSVAATACGPAGSSTTTLVINALPTATAGSVSSTICSGATINLTSSGGSSYAWVGPNSFTSTSQNPSITTAGTTATGTYTVTVTGAGGCTATATTSVTVNSTPVISVSGLTTICSGGSATLTAGGGSTYVWNTGATTPSITVSPTSTTTYTVTGTSSLGCVGLPTTFTVIVTAPPVATITGSSTVCAGQSVTLTAGGGSPVLWSNGATTTSITVNPTVATTYSVTVGTGCTDTASISVGVSSLPTPSISGITTVIQGTSTTLTASGGTSYLWTPSAGLSCTTCAATTATPLSTIQYCVTATNANGCSDSTCVIVDVNIECGELFVPTAFSPDGQGDLENETLKIRGNPACITDLNFVIFDRWGEKVFETSDPTQAWDGTYKGKALDAAVFVYYLKASVSGVAVNKHGNITLVK